MPQLLPKTPHPFPKSFQSLSLKMRATIKNAFQCLPKNSHTSTHCQNSVQFLSQKIVAHFQKSISNLTQKIKSYTVRIIPFKQFFIKLPEIHFTPKFLSQKTHLPKLKNKILHRSNYLFHFNFSHKFFIKLLEMHFTPKFLSLKNAPPEPCHLLISSLMPPTGVSSISSHLISHPEQN